MNKNNINFQVNRTKEGTICEIACGLLILLSLILSFTLLPTTAQGGIAMLIQTCSIALGVLLMLILVYQPNNFNIPDNSPAELFIATVRFVRITAVLMSVLSLAVTLSAIFCFEPYLIFGIFGLIFVPLLCWYFHIYVKAKHQKTS